MTMGREADLRPSGRGGKVTDRCVGHGGSRLDAKGAGGSVGDLRDPPSFRILPPFLRNVEVEW